MATNKSLSRRTIFLLAAAILYLMIPQNATMPMPEEAVFPFSLLSLSQIARVFAFQTMDCHGFDSFLQQCWSSCS